MWKFWHIWYITRHTSPQQFYPINVYQMHPISILYTASYIYIVCIIIYTSSLRTSSINLWKKFWDELIFDTVCVMIIFTISSSIRNISAGLFPYFDFTLATAKLKFCFLFWAHKCPVESFRNCWILGATQKAIVSICTFLYHSEPAECLVPESLVL